MFTNPAHANDGNTYTFGHFEVGDDQERLNKTSKSLKFRILATSSAIAGVVLLAIALTFAILYFKKTSDSKTATPTPMITSNITVYYAASLQDIMTRLINPDFTTQTSIGVKTVPGASGVLAKLLKGGAVADVFISADKKIVSSLFAPVHLPNSTTPVLSWYTFWATTRLGIAYNTESPFVGTFESIVNKTVNWYDVLDPEKGMRIGRTDPNTDPKGYRTVIMMRLAEMLYKVSGIEKRVFNSQTSQIHNEAALEKLLTGGDIDVGFFYDCEKQWTDKIKFIPFDVNIDMSDLSRDSYYALRNYTNTVTKVVTPGSTVAYTLSIPSTSTNKKDAIKYIMNLRSKKGALKLAIPEGLDPLVKPSLFYGNLSTVPIELKTQNTTF